MFELCKMNLNIMALVVWSSVAGLCFLAIPIHLSGKENTQMETFKNYIQVFNKSYDDKKINDKLLKFEESLNRISELNSVNNRLKTSGKDSSTNSISYWEPGMPKNAGAALWGLTQFADMSPEEFQMKYLDNDMLERILQRQSSNSKHHRKHFKQNQTLLNMEEKITNSIDSDEDSLLIVRKKRASSSKSKSKIPEKVDWREKNVISGIKHQKNCGACWAFSTVETLESMHAVQGGTLETLSVQQVIDCAGNGNRGCAGGDTCSALQWMLAQPITSEDKYPLTLKDGTCPLKNMKSGVKVANFTCDNFETTEDNILSMLANHGPLVAAVDATNWQYYVGGIIQWNCDTNNNHAVQIVGYDKTGSPPYYIVRNSWGTSFGDNGYLYIAIGSNLCGIAREISSVNVNAKV